MMRDLLQVVGLELAVAGGAEHQTNFAAFGHLAVDGGYGHLSNRRGQGLEIHAFYDEYHLI